MDLKAYKGFAFDLDGVIWRGKEVIPGAPEIVNTLRERGASLVFVTNNAGQHRAQQLAKLQSFGIAAQLSEMITSGSTAMHYISTIRPGSSVFVLGTDDLRQEARDEKLVVLTDVPQPAADFVVVGFDSDFSYQKLNNALQHLLRGARFVACNENPTYPVEEGLRPGNGALVAALACAAGRQPEVVCGKPHRPIMENTLNVLGTKPSESLFISDLIDIDLVGSAAVGMDSLFVLSGVGTIADLNRVQFKPTAVLNSVREML